MFHIREHIIDSDSIHNTGRCDSDYWFCIQTMIDVTIIQIKVSKVGLFHIVTPLNNSVSYSGDWSEWSKVSTISFII